MKIVHQEVIVDKGAIAGSSVLRTIKTEINSAIKSIKWPEDSKGFYLNPDLVGKGRGQGNGVKPIKQACITYLKECGWQEERRVRDKGVAGTGPLDALKRTKYGFFALEWETGNISSSHRALNKICLGVATGELAGGILVVPSDKLYPFLTDRVGNFRELIPYLPLWRMIPYKAGNICITVVEHDGLDKRAPRISKGTDGRALL